VTRESKQVCPGPAPDFQHTASPILVERHESGQMMELLEMILLEIGEEALRARRMRCDLQIVDVRIPISSNGVL
jgi:hypothetical protein